MPSKLPASCNASGKETKRQKNVMTLNEKIALLDVPKERKSNMQQSAANTTLEEHRSDIEKEVWGLRRV